MRNRRIVGELDLQVQGFSSGFTMKLAGKIKDFPAETLLLVRVGMSRHPGCCKGGMLNPDSVRSTHREKVGNLVFNNISKLQVRNTGL